ncbi:hypothetical protein KJ940_02990 [Myxococcota bacterium]|nr:hypothetical protein [Myxococcota bacterium]
MKRLAQILIVYLYLISSIGVASASQLKLNVGESLLYMGNENLHKDLDLNYTLQFYILNDVIMYSWNCLSKHKNFDPNRYSKRTEDGIDVLMTALSLYSNLNKVIEFDAEFLRNYINQNKDFGIALLRIIGSSNKAIFENIQREFGEIQIEDHALKIATDQIVNLMINLPDNFHDRINFLVALENKSRYRPSPFAGSILLFEAIRSNNLFNDTVIFMYESYLKSNSTISNDEIEQLDLLFFYAVLISLEKFVNRININEYLAFSRKYNRERIAKNTLTLTYNDMNDSGGLGEDLILGYTIFRISQFMSLDKISKNPTFLNQKF